MVCGLKFNKNIDYIIVLWSSIAAVTFGTDCQASFLIQHFVQFSFLHFFFLKFIFISTTFCLILKKRKRGTINQSSFVLDIIFYLVQVHSLWRPPNLSRTKNIVFSGMHQPLDLWVRSISLSLQLPSLSTSINDTFLFFGMAFESLTALINKLHFLWSLSVNFISWIKQQIFFWGNI